MRLLLILLFISLSSCVVVGGPSEDPPLDKYFIEVNYYQDLKALKKVCGLKLIGCAEPYVNPCKIHLLKQDWHVYILESQHCFHGFWHD